MKKFFLVFLSILALNLPFVATQPVQAAPCGNYILTSWGEGIACVVNDYRNAYYRTEQGYAQRNLTVAQRKSLGLCVGLFQYVDARWVQRGALACTYDAQLKSLGLSFADLRVYDVNADGTRTNTYFGLPF